MKKFIHFQECTWFVSSDARSLNSFAIFEGQSVRACWKFGHDNFRMTGTNLGRTIFWKKSIHSQEYSWLVSLLKNVDVNINHSQRWFFYIFTRKHDAIWLTMLPNTLLLKELAQNWVLIFDCFEWVSKSDVSIKP